MLAGERPLETLVATIVLKYCLVPYVSTESITIKLGRASGRESDPWTTAEELLAEFVVDDSRD